MRLTLYRTAVGHESDDEHHRQKTSEHGEYEVERRRAVRRRRKILPVSSGTRRAARRARRVLPRDGRTAGEVVDRRRRSLDGSSAGFDVGAAPLVRAERRVAARTGPVFHQPGVRLVRCGIARSKRTGQSIRLICPMTWQE